MSNTNKPSNASGSDGRRDRDKAKPYRPPNNGKPPRLDSGGAR